jgi:hypothetical protein
MTTKTWYEAVNERLAALEREVDELQRRTLPMVPFGPVDPPWPKARCLVCGEPDHGGLPCPRMAPMSTGGEMPK